MSEPQDTYQLYKTPNIATIGAYVSVAVAIFFGAYVMSMRSHVTRREIQYQRELQEAHTRVDRLTLKLMQVSNELHDTHTARLRTPDFGQVALPSRAVQKTDATEEPADKVTQANDHLTDAPESLPEANDLSTPDVVAARSLPATEDVQGEAVEREPGLVRDAPGVDDAEEAPFLAEIPELPEFDATIPAPAAAAADPVVPARVFSEERPLPGTVPPSVAAVETEAFLSEAEALEGEIIVFNPEKQLVMVNLGRNRGAEVGRRFTLWRDGAYLGDVRVQRVFANMSACEIITALDKEVRVGDIARSVGESPAP